MFFFFFNVTSSTGIYTYLHTLSLHAALPILREHHRLEVAAEQQRVHRQHEDRRADPGDEQQDIDGQREEIAADQAGERGEREADILPPADIDRPHRPRGIMADHDTGAAAEVGHTSGM